MISKDDRLLSRLQNACARKEYCSKDIYAKALKGLDGDAEGAAQMLELLVKDKYVDDARYAAAFARDKSSLSGWGPVKISYQLRAKGIDSAVISDALRQIDDDKAEDALTKLLSAKYRSLKGDEQLRLKLIRFALSRGYEYDVVDAAVRKIMADG